MPSATTHPASPRPPRCPPHGHMPHPPYPFRVPPDTQARGARGESLVPMKTERPAPENRRYALHDANLPSLLEP